MPVFFSPAVLNVFGCKVVSMTNSSSVNIGPACLTDLNAVTKSNTGSGSSFGDFALNIHGPMAVFDSDVIDSMKKGSIL